MPDYVDDQFDPTVRDSLSRAVMLNPPLHWTPEEIAEYIKQREALLDQYLTKLQTIYYHIHRLLKQCESRKDKEEVHELLFPEFNSERIALYLAYDSSDFGDVFTYRF